ncbi:MAG TPA: MBL fold metallo-hydrolase, partial [Thermoanaerobaculia bacterium]|nr:MBL fold metallo-hydrolase [Thermoanaerobaculia bacterium]
MLERFTWYKQSSYRWRDDDLVVYIDPWQVTGDPVPADVIFLTHAHYDHYSPDDLGRLRKEDTRIVAPHDIAAELTGNVQAVAPGDS